MSANTILVHNFGGKQLVEWLNYIESVHVGIAAYVYTLSKAIIVAWTDRISGSALAYVVVSHV